MVPLLRVAGVALGIGLLMKIWSPYSTSGSTGPWIETGVPTKNREQWRIRACGIHHRLYQMDPHAALLPIHDILGLDATSHPFRKHHLSRQPTQIYYDAAHQKLAHAFQQHIHPVNLRITQGGEPSEADVDLFNLLVAAYSLLSDDHSRFEYADHFVGVLTKRDMLAFAKDEKKVVQKKLDKLEQLCA